MVQFHEDARTPEVRGRLGRLPTFLGEAPSEVPIMKGHDSGAEKNLAKIEHPIGSQW